MMYEGKIVAEAAVAAPADVRFVAADGDADGSALLGFLILLIGLPLLLIRLFAYVLLRNGQRLAGFARLVGGAYADARRG